MGYYQSQLVSQSSSEFDELRFSQELHYRQSEGKVKANCPKKATIPPYQC
jgi:hypothetical protein